MPITPEQREQRRLGLGSSDSPPVVGVDPWKTSTDVWIEKVLPTDDLKSNDAIEMGNDFEHGLLVWAARELGVEFDENVPVISPDQPIMRANLDGRIKGKPLGLEAKVTSLGDQWGTEGTDEIPERVIVQTQHQMFCAGLDTVYVPMLTAEYGRLVRKLYVVRRSDELIAAIVDRGLAFWEDYVRPRRMPSAFPPSLEIVKRIRRTHKPARVPSDLVQNYKLAALAAKNAEKAKEDAQALLLAAAGDADLLDAGDPAKVWTYNEQSRTTVEGTALKINHPAIHEKYSKTSTFRVLREVNRF